MNNSGFQIPYLAIPVDFHYNENNKRNDHSEKGMDFVGGDKDESRNVTHKRENAKRSK